ncbi:Peptidyl-prolyl cis-trans isomerase FKBP16-4 [Spatholobus suberectus]|nr:Peptidyl-prolyl cis-trans isomerase FKBP16-4 [Spatholobus suberectus]
MLKLLQPYGFDVGQPERGTIHKGLDLGVQGMRVGGQRLLIVPPELAYGSKGVQEIPPNSTIEVGQSLARSDSGDDQIWKDIVEDIMQWR